MRPGFCFVTGSGEGPVRPVEEGREELVTQTKVDSLQLNASFDSLLLPLPLK